jgi:hypothetical protein
VDEGIRVSSPLLASVLEAEEANGNDDDDDDAAADDDDMLVDGLDDDVDGDVDIVVFVLATSAFA